MSDQLDAEVQPTVTVDVETTETETVEAQTDQTSETVSDSGENHEEKPIFTPEQKAIAAKAFEAREARRENEDLKKQIEGLKSQQPGDARPIVPELSEFPASEELASWQSATTDALTWDNTQKSQKEDAYNAQVTVQNQRLADQTKIDNDFVATANTAGIGLEDLRLANDFIISSGVDPVLQQAMKQDPDGGAMYLHLTRNPESMQAMLGATLLNVSTVYADIKAKASTLKPKASNAPPPPTDVKSSGPTSETDPLLEGITITTS